jgi:hypothetical protein
MPSLADLQADVARAVITGRVNQTSADLVGGSDPLRRFAIHARHYERSLTAALETKFPATAWLIGTSAFRDAARAYIRAWPPERPCIAEYGAEFPDFLGSAENLRRFAYVGGFAALEWAAGQVSIAVALPPIDWAAVAAQRPEGLIDRGLRMQPGLGYLRCDWPVDALLKVYLGSSNSERFVLEREGVCIEVQGARGSLKLTRLEPAAFTFRRALRMGSSIGHAAERALDRDAHFDAGAELRRAVDAGLVTQLSALDDGGDR